MCKIKDCEGKVKAKGLCIKHYTRKIRYGDPNITKIIVGDSKKRLIDNSVIAENGCMEWAKFKKNGYGVTSLNGRLEQAHRASWKVFNGEIPKGLQVNHKCHNRSCINIDHLYIGTQKENMKDMALAGRGNKAKGSKSGTSILSEEDVINIRSDISFGRKACDIAQKYNVANTTISAIKVGRTWGWLK
jgi:hypothetical protein